MLSTILLVDTITPRPEPLLAAVHDEAIGRGGPAPG